MSRAAVLLARHLVQRCTIAPASDGAADGYNQPGNTPGTAVTGIRCRLTDLTDEEIATVSQESVQLFNDALLVPRETVVEPDAVVTNLLDRDGVTVIDAGPLVVVDVTMRYSDRAEYKRLVLKKVR